MEDIIVTIAAALALGLVARELRIPPLVGFLGAGFLLHFLGVTAFDGLEQVSDLGVVLLLFTIGLKFDLRSLLQPEAYGTAALHMISSVFVGAGTIGLAAVVGVVSLDGGLGTIGLLGFALSFSSTVLVVKVLEDRSDDGSYYGQIAIAILVIQDIAAVAFITVAGEEPPSPWAFALVLVVPAAWVLRRVLDRVGRGELLVLFGVVMALGPGYVAFVSVGIHGDLGALVMGLLFATHPRSSELSKSLFSVKELFLVAFFVVIGLQAIPTWADLLMALILCVILIPFNFLSFFLMGRLFGLRNRTSIRTSLALSNFSEFALIVVAVGAANGVFEDSWLTVTALAVAIGMIISSLANAYSLQIVGRLDEILPDENESKLRLPDRPIDTGSAEVVVLGMGRIGRGAYERLVDNGGLSVIGVDNDHQVVEELKREKFNVLEGDATDHEFWHRLVVGGSARTVILAMAIHDSNTFALEQLRIAAFDGAIAAVVQRQDQADALTAAGVHTVVNIYGGSGAEVADAAMRLPTKRRPDDGGQPANG
ncbi:transporter, CPA2 family [Brevibacterium sp. 239c]|uniref:cation:proton antiporter family protein n=1 Tax=Brevibacterium sp. 239c TaxID=1965356 RepID=UPI000C5917AB|nr:cation:proton antiporter family protein [Brevibacterium sp. 239c]SMX74534.1 transporter, CPA2 family [Brevibacterium sp. 239c]